MSRKVGRKLSFGFIAISVISIIIFAVFGFFIAVWLRVCSTNVNSFFLPELFLLLLLWSFLLLSRRH